MLGKEFLKKAVILENSNLRTAMISIKSTGLNMAVVVNNHDHVVGVITDGDIRKQLIINEDLYESVTICMSKDFLFVIEGYKREEVLKLLDKKIHKIPVLNSKMNLVDIVGSGYSEPDSCIISRARTPARVSLAGGGTDFTDYFMDQGGAGLSCTIAKYSHAVLRKRTDQKIKIYSHDFRQRIEIDHVNDIQYDGKLDLIKAGVKLLNPKFGFELEIGCDFSPASGLGGSASLLSSVIGCFNEFREYKLDRYAIAEYAFEAERIELDIAGGWQDQYSTVFGGFNYLEFDRKHNIVMPIRLESSNLREIEERLILCHTKQEHLGNIIQKDSNKKYCATAKQIKFNSERLKEITSEMKRNLLRNRYDDFALLLGETWAIKKDGDSRVTNERLDEIYATALDAGALGGRLLGTGGGGYFLFYTPPFYRYQVMGALERLNLDPEGVILDQHGITSWRV
ncbi:MAG: CBS domain-containing protein [Candidatus Marinimicrobia bacterium]|jgi:D-glycero-alpha-D-manno-heptose-7-phosphate kinase|nr:CBS domain-containing protein [Candidatus Neomarinimicrobiota bacterium]